MSAHPEVEEIHSVAGDTAMLLKVRTADAQVGGLLTSLQHRGVVGTRAYIVLSTYLERPVQPDLTREWPQQDDGQSVMQVVPVPTQYEADCAGSKFSFQALAASVGRMVSM